MRSSAARSLLGICVTLAGSWTTRAEAALPCAATELPAGDASRLVKALAERGAASSELDTGAAGDELVSVLTASVCAAPDRARFLVATCAPSRGGGLAELRRRVLVDSLRAPAAALDERLASLSEEQRVLARVALAALDGALRGLTPEEFADRLARDSGVLGFRCGPDGPPVRDELTLAGRVLARVLEASPALVHPPAQLLPLVVDTVRAGGHTPIPLDRAEHWLGHLRFAVIAVHQARDPGAQVTALARLAAVSLGLVTDHVPRVPTSLAATVTPLAQGDLPAAVTAVADLARDLGAGDLALGGLARAARLASARTQDEAERAVRGLLLGLGPWSDPWLFDVDAVVPRLDSDEFRVGGGLLLGYSGKGWGVAARGSLYDYDFQRGSVIRQTESAGGGLDGWFTLGTTVRFEGRGSFAAQLYNTDAFAPATTAIFADETSVMGRGTLLAGLRVEPGERFAFGVWAGGGLQIESYSRDALVGQTFTDDSQDNTALRFEGRLRLHYLVVPRWLALRAQIDAQTFQITRNAAAARYDGTGTVSYDQTASTLNETEAHARAFVDAEALRVLGFVPALTGGFDYFATSGGGAPSESTVVPVAGIGVRRTSY